MSTVIATWFCCCLRSHCLTHVLCLLLSAMVIGCTDPAEDNSEPADPEAVIDVQPTVANLRVSNVVRFRSDDPKIEWEAAITLAHLCQVASTDSATRQKLLGDMGFAEIELLDEGPRSGFIATAEDVAVIAFRGTDDVADWIANADIRQLADLGSERKLHTGFQGAYSTFASRIYDRLQTQDAKYIWITGHSLGGAMAACCAFDLLKQDIPFTGVVTFGQPRIGNDRLAEFLSETIESRYLRVMNGGDPVPIMPPCFGIKLPAYWHSGRRIWSLWGNPYMKHGPTIVADLPPDADGAALETTDLDEDFGKDDYLSITEEDFIEFQRQLSEGNEKQQAVMAVPEREQRNEPPAGGSSRNPSSAFSKRASASTAWTSTWFNSTTTAVWTLHKNQLPIWRPGSLLWSSRDNEATPSGRRGEATPTTEARRVENPGKCRTLFAQLGVARRRCLAIASSLLLNLHENRLGQIGN